MFDFFSSSLELNIISEEKNVLQIIFKYFLYKKVFNLELITLQYIMLIREEKIDKQRKLCPGYMYGNCSCLNLVKISSVCVDRQAGRQTDTGRHVFTVNFAIAAYSQTLNSQSHTVNILSFFQC